jgi:hypothetical protein
MGPRTQRLKRAAYVGRVARRGGLLRVLRELGVWGSRPSTREGAQEFREALEELGTTYIKLGQLLSSRPDLLPDVYIEELGKLVDEVPPVPFREIEQVIAAELPRDTFAQIRARALHALEDHQNSGRALTPLLDRDVDQIAPLGPGAVVVPDVLVAEQLAEDEPGMRAALTDPAVRRDRLVVRHALLPVDLA